MKIADRIVLGTIAGLIGNLAKLAVTGRARNTGILNDATIAAAVGVAATYVLSATGKDRAALKGAILGVGAWNILQGLMGETAVTPKTVLSGLVGQAVYGAATALAVTRFGDERLFTGHPLPVKYRSFRLENGEVKKQETELGTIRWIETPQNDPTVKQLH